MNDDPYYCDADIVEGSWLPCKAFDEDMISYAELMLAIERITRRTMASTERQLRLKSVDVGDESRCQSVELLDLRRERPNVDDDSPTSDATEGG